MIVGALRVRQGRRRLLMAEATNTMLGCGLSDSGTRVASSFKVMVCTSGSRWPSAPASVASGLLAKLRFAANFLQRRAIGLVVSFHGEFCSGFEDSCA